VPPQRHDGQRADPDDGQGPARTDPSVRLLIRNGP
jgi:hypothetical protein